MATTELCPLMGLPDELLVYIVDASVQFDKAITIHGFSKGYIAKSCSTVRTLLRPFRACRRLWRIANDEIYRVNSFAQTTDISLEGCDPTAFLKYAADAQQAMHVELRLSQLNVNDLRLQRGLKEFGQVNLQHFTDNYPVMRTLTIDVYHDARQIQMPFYPRYPNGTEVEQGAGYGKNIAGRLRAIMSTIAKFAPQLKGVEVYMQLTQVKDKKQYRAFKIDGRKADRRGIALEAMDYPKCRVRIA
ncbi:hypothetical protein LTR10_008405 [Elasticomyces elasticus]|nr:hypothetical protein LTR10_008405 [Elasticomyces elasticus]KAK4967279.1 hypothetical protein LTR42_010628 [Elasticomyces elasticus]